MRLAAPSTAKVGASRLVAACGCLLDPNPNTDSRRTSLFRRRLSLRHTQFDQDVFHQAPARQRRLKQVCANERGEPQPIWIHPMCQCETGQDKRACKQSNPSLYTQGISSFTRIRDIAMIPMPAPPGLPAAANARARGAASYRTGPGPSCG